MEPAVDRAFTDEIKAECGAAFGARVGDLELFGDHENYVFGFTNREGRQQVLRVTHPIHRSRSQILAELHWVNYLRDNGVAIAGALPSENGNMVEVVGDEPFFVSSFEFAPGRLPTDDDWVPDLFEQWGELQARTHRLSTEYMPPPDLEPRFSMLEEPYVVGAEEAFEDQPLVLEKWRDHRGELEALSTDRSVYGLIHTDLYQANFHVNDGKMVMFDSDDCGYAWFVEDISSSLYYGVRHPGSGTDEAAWVSEFLPAYWRGYRNEYDLGPDWLDELPRFLWGRALMIHSMIQTKWDVDNLSSEEAEFMEWGRRRIETGEGAWWLGIDFRQVAMSER